MCLDLFVSYTSRRFPSNIPKIIGHDWGNYLTFNFEITYIFPVLLFRVLCYQPLCYNCFHFVSVFASVLETDAGRQLNTFPHRSSSGITLEEEPTFAVSCTANTAKICTGGLLIVQAVLLSGDQDCNKLIMAWTSIYHCYSAIVW
jgi:hypothetical protein